MLLSTMIYIAISCLQYIFSIIVDSTVIGGVFNTRDKGKFIQKESLGLTQWIKESEFLSDLNLFGYHRLWSNF